MAGTEISNSAPWWQRLAVLTLCTQGGQGSAEWFSLLDAVSVLVSLCEQSEQEHPNAPQPIPASALNLHVDKVAGQTKLYKWFTVTEDQSAYDAAKIIVDHEVARVAVVDAANPLNLRAVVTDSRLIRLLLAGEGPSTRRLFNSKLRDLGLVGNRGKPGEGTAAVAAESCVQSPSGSARTRRSSRRSRRCKSTVCAPSRWSTRTLFKTRRSVCGVLCVAHR